MNSKTKLGGESKNVTMNFTFSLFSFAYFEAE